MGGLWETLIGEMEKEELLDYMEEGIEGNLKLIFGFRDEFIKIWGML